MKSELPKERTNSQEERKQGERAYAEREGMPVCVFFKVLFPARRVFSLSRYQNSMFSHVRFR
jgi:hypothetical protein